MGICSENITKARIKAIVQKRVDVVVITAGALKEQIEEKESLSLELFHTFVLDECHHATGIHTYSILLQMMNSIPRKKRPRLLGLSASPFKVENKFKGSNELIKFMSNFPEEAFLYRAKSIEQRGEPELTWYPIELSKEQQNFTTLACIELKEVPNKCPFVEPGWTETVESTRKNIHQIQGVLRLQYQSHSAIEVLNALTMVGAIEIALVLGVKFAVDMLNLQSACCICCRRVEFAVGMLNLLSGC